MRRLWSGLLFTFAAIAAIPLVAKQGGGQAPMMVFKGAPNTPIAAYSNNRLLQVGATTNLGQFNEDPALFSGKPKVYIRFDTCPTGNQISLFPAGPASDAERQKCPNACQCNDNKGGFFLNWGDSYAVNSPWLQTSFFFDNPASWVVVGGGAAGAVLLLKGGGGPGKGTTFEEVVLQTFTITLTVVSQSAGCGFVNSTGTLTFTGTINLVTGVLKEGTTTFTYSGGVGQNDTNLHFFAFLTGSGVVNAQTDVSTLDLNFDNAGGITGTKTNSLPCGQVTQSLTGKAT